METPNNEAGRTTDAIMSEVRAQLPELPTSQFNTIWEAVYKVLSWQSDSNPYKQLSNLMAKRDEEMKQYEEDESLLVYPPKSRAKNFVRSTFRGFSIDY